jgi:hypothetical protein
MNQTTLAPARVTVRASDLLEAGIVALESQQYVQCTSYLRRDGMYCAEGVFADQLVQAYPERYGWMDKDALVDRRDGEVWVVLGGEVLSDLHPRGGEIFTRAANRLGYAGIAVANDRGKTFAEIAAALREARAEVEQERVP